jgi:large subunit ribosomal protein L28
MPYISRFGGLHRQRRFTEATLSVWRPEKRWKRLVAPEAEAYSQFFGRLEKSDYQEMISSCSFAIRGITKLSCMARQSLVRPSSESTRHFFVQSGSVETSPISLDCQLTTVRHRSNRSRRGLYDGKDIRSGNNVSFSMKATKRKFKPNVFKKRVYSEILDEMIRFHITTSALRSIDKAGGLDNYLLKSRHVRDGEGLEVKKRIQKMMKARQRKESSGLMEEDAGLMEEDATEKGEQGDESRKVDEGSSTRN